jgi:hypothetical protein
MVLGSFQQSPYIQRNKVETVFSVLKRMPRPAGMVASVGMPDISRPPVQAQIPPEKRAEGLA